MRYLKLLFHIFLLMLLPAMVAAGEKTLFSKTFYSDESFVVGGTVYLVNVDTYDRVIFDFENQFLIVMNSSCKRVDYTKICVEKINYDNVKKEKKAEIKVYSLGPEVKVSRSLTGGNFLVGEEIEVTVTIKNSGAKDAENVTYMDVFPNDIEITETDGVKVEPTLVMWKNETTVEWQEGSNIFWEGRVETDETVEFSYKLRPKRQIDETFKATITYFDGIDFEEEETASIRIKASYFIDIDTKFVEKDYIARSKDSILSGKAMQELQMGYDEYKLIVVLKSNVGEGDDVTVKYIDFSFPPGVEYISSSFVNTDEGIVYGTKVEKVRDDLVRWSGDLKEEKRFIFKVKGTLSGDRVISISGEFEKEDENGKKVLQQYHTNAEIEVETYELEIRSSFDENQHFDSGQKALFNIYIQNPNDDIEFTDLDIKLDIPWVAEKELKIAKLETFSYKTLVEGIFTLPKVNKTTTYPFNMNVSYKTGYGESFMQKFSRKIIIDKIADLDILTTIDSSLTEGEESTVTIEIRNNGNEEIKNVYVESIPDPRLNDAGTLSRQVNIRAKSTIDILTYKIKTPYVQNITKFRIVSRASYTKSGMTYSSSDEKTVEINPSSVKLKITKKISGSDVFRGASFFMDYSITNNYEEAVENITLLFPPQMDLDTVGNRIYQISRIEPKKTIFLNDIEEIRPKTNESLKLEETLVEFNNANGDFIKTKSNKITTSVEAGMIRSPAVIIEKYLSASSAKNNEEFNVILNLRNIGNEAVDVTVKDIGKEWLVKLSGNSEEMISYKLVQTTVGTATLQKALANYSSNGRMHYTASNEQKINILQGEVEQAENPADVAAETEVFVKQGWLGFNIKYLYVLLPVIVVAVVLMLAIRKKPKKKSETA